MRDLRRRAAALLGTTVNQQSTTTSLHHCRYRSCGLVFICDTISDCKLGAAYKFP